MDWFDRGITIFAVIVLPLSMFFMGRKLAKMDKRGELRKEENVLILRGLDVVGGMASATAKAVRDGHANGEVTESLERYGDYKCDLKLYLYQQASPK